MFMDWETNIVKLAVLPELIYGLNTTPIRFTVTSCFFCRKWLRRSQDLYGNAKEPQQSKQF